MKKAVLIIAAILLMVFIIGNAEQFQDFATTISSGAVIPVIVALLFAVVRYITQAESYVAAFEAVQFKTTLWHNLVIILSLMFVNTFVVPAGSGSLPFIIGDAHKRGADIGTATSGALLSQIGFFSALFFISIVGIVVMLFTNSFNIVVLIGFFSTTIVLVVEVGAFVIGYFKPKLLISLLHWIEKLCNWFLRLFKREPAHWAADTATSFIDSSQMLAKNVHGIVLTIAWASLSAIMNMGCFIAIGFAFGYVEVMPLVAAFTVAVVSIMLSPTPQGVGVTEAAIALILTIYNSTLSIATAIALVYRGIMLWIPFCLGALLLSQSGFFKEKEKTTPTEERKKKDVGWISGTLMAVLGIANILIATLSPDLDAYTMLTQFVDLSNTLAGPALIAGGVLLVALGITLILRLRIGWAVSMAVLSILGGSELVVAQTITVAIPLILLAVWLFIKRRSFDRSGLLGRSRA